MLLTRERWRSFFDGLGRPIGVPHGGPGEMYGKNWARVPHTPRWATVLLLLASAGIFTYPEVRESLSSVLGNYTNPEWEPSRWRSVKKLRKVVETNRDPQLLAWLSLLSTDRAERIRLSEEAIEKDSSLTWLDYQQSLWPLNDPSRQHYLPTYRIERLRRWDPDNAVTHLLAAEAISPLRSEARRAMVRNGPKIEWEKMVTRDSRWLAEMERAFTAPKYNSYVLEKFQLARAVSKKYGIKDRDPTFYILMQMRMLQFEMLRAYTDYLMEVGAKAEPLGNMSAAESAYWQILRFSERLAAGQPLPIDKMFGTTVGMKAGARLQPLLKNSGRTDEAMLLGFQLAEWNAWRDQQFKPSAPKNENWKIFRRDGFTIQVSTLVVVLLTGAFVFSQIIVWLRRRTTLEKRGRTFAFFCRMADVGPLLILLSSAALFVAYHPYGEVYKNFLTQQSLPDMDTLIAAGSVTRFVPRGLLHRADARMVFWTVITAALTLAVAFLSFRMLTREMVSRSR